MEKTETSTRSSRHRQPTVISKIIFASRWLQLPIYLGLIVVQGIYAYKFMKSLWALLTGINELDSNAIMLSVLNLIDVVMIANLLVMVIIGGYEIFVSKLNTENHPDEPEWLDHVNASVLKVKLSMSIISISSIHMLQTFVNAANMPEKTMMWQLFLHLGFLVSAVAMAYTDKILYSTSHKTH
ncbi:TIGR00645 family protein [Actinobacillus porcinus]|uniref:TIGR00645 family protein n=1 Tax=Actinobacillus porcinus TaxID=51048 RepID=UPI002354BDEB|nr:TIGR00645 family protein [Actinobacillus porcinus]MCI5762914.1 TIGR00645 family protein [Actinobacillus porcinus]MDD7545085.1 TIGR00645 family protein [Actinobacillus porcinus]MDY5420909.1 TIGR00645 family protein [Actinobacillus porcinus]MDY5847759.1 TIGR00645 family protein [Actinobacillus porcinus]